MSILVTKIAYIVSNAVSKVILILKTFDSYKEDKKTLPIYIILLPVSIS